MPAITTNTPSAQKESRSLDSEPRSCVESRNSSSNITDDDSNRDDTDDWIDVDYHTTVYKYIADGFSTADASISASQNVYGADDTNADVATSTTPDSYNAGVTYDHSTDEYYQYYYQSGRVINHDEEDYIPQADGMYYCEGAWHYFEDDWRYEPPDLIENYWVYVVPRVCEDYEARERTARTDEESEFVWELAGGKLQEVCECGEEHRVKEVGEAW